MGRKYTVHGCRGNYPGDPYSKVDSFPDKDEYPDEWERWIEAMPNKRKTLEELKEIWLCATHFNCEWKKVRGWKKAYCTTVCIPWCAKIMFKTSIIQRPCIGACVVRAFVRAYVRACEVFILSKWISELTLKQQLIFKRDVILTNNNFSH